MKRISQETDAKLRVRGRFSGHLEGPRMQESDDPLQLCVSAPSEESHKRAQEMVEQKIDEQNFRVLSEMRKVRKSIYKNPKSNFVIPLESFFETQRFEISGVENP